MQLTTQTAKHLRDVYFGGNWTASNLKQHLTDLTWQQATTKVYELNTIATLVNHMTYYVCEVTKVLQGEPLTAKDKFSFEHPPIQSQADWDNFLEKIWAEAEIFAQHIEKLSDEQLAGDFSDPKYGSYYRNLNGIIEHLHYHLGQVVVIKKIILQQKVN